jgi:hypothetical protein
MADSNLPIVNAIEDLKADNAKQRKALQDSLGRRFRILSAEIGVLGSAIASSFDLQYSQAQLNSELLTKLTYGVDNQNSNSEAWFEFQKEQAKAEDFRSIENLRELKRLGDRDNAQPQQDQKKDDEKSKGIFGKLLGGIGGIVKGLGFGGLLAGAGILMAGGGFLLSELNDLDGAAIRENVKELIGIKDDFGGIGGFFLEGGTFGLTMLGIGVGLAVFGAGSAVAGLGNAIANFTNPRWASSIVDNVATLLSLPDRVDFGSLGMLFKGGAFGLAMLGVGTGLAFFGAGSAIAGLGNGLANFIDPNWRSLLLIMLPHYFLFPKYQKFKMQDS